MTINDKSERNYRGKCLDWPVTSYGGAGYYIYDSPLYVLKKERKERCRKRGKKLSKKDNKNDKKSHSQEQNKTKKWKQKHTRVRVVELREQALFTS